MAFAEHFAARGVAIERLELRVPSFAHLADAELVPTNEERARIEGCADPAILDRWIKNSLRAKIAHGIWRPG